MCDDIYQTSLLVIILCFDTQLDSEIEWSGHPHWEMRLGRR